MASSSGAKSAKNLLTDREREIIREAATAAFAAGVVRSETRTKDAFKGTERRLYNLPVLRLKVENDKERLTELRIHGSPMHSKSVVRFDRTGSRLKPDEMIDAIVQDVNAQIAASEYEIETVEKALSIIESDPYFKIIPYSFFDGMTAENASYKMPCERSTFFRHKARLIQRLAVFLYGVDAT
jgi:hypothetical protein